MKILLIFLGFLLVMSIVTFFFYLADKQKAKKGKWRIKEAVLLGLGFFGGAIGGLVGMNVFRHKTKHWYFWAGNVFFVLLQVAAAIWICLKCL